MTEPNEPRIYTGKPTIKLTIEQDHKAIAKQAAVEIANAIREKNAAGQDFVLGLATGVTMEPVYEELIRMHQEEDLSFAKVKFFNLDAYKGLPDDDRNAYAYQLKELFLNKVDAKPDNITLVSGVDFDPAIYEQKIAAAGGIDVQLLGLGGEGHIGFNEVGSEFDSRTREIPLSPRTRSDNAHFFDRDGEVVPTHAYTMGVGTILEAKRIIALASGDNKAWAIRNMMDASGLLNEELSSLELAKDMKWQTENLPEGERSVPEAYLGREAFWVRSKSGAEAYRKKELAAHAIAQEEIVAGKPVEELPARALHAHPNVTMLVDEKAASMVRLENLIEHSNLETTEAIEAHIAKFSPKEVELTINGAPQKLWLSPGFDFFDPKIMGLNEVFDIENPSHKIALETVLSRTTDTYIGAHQDDAEIEAGPIILAATRDPEKHWLNIIMTDGAASRSALNISDSTEKVDLSTIPAIRVREQREAAIVSGVPVIQLGYPSAAVNELMGKMKKMEIGHTLGSLFNAMPHMTTSYGHNPLDKHDTHMGSFACWMSALRSGAPQVEKVVGLEGWGGLCGLNHSDLERFIAQSPEDVDTITDWIKVYKSQITLQGRPYDGATMGRMHEHAGYVTSPHGSNPPAGMVIGIDVTEQAKDPAIDTPQMVETILNKAKIAKIKMAEKHRILPAPELGGSPWAGRAGSDGSWAKGM